MIARISRLVRAEFIKIASQYFLYVALGIVAVVILLWGWLGPIVGGQGETAWRAPHALQYFAHGFRWGLKIAIFVLVIFSSMIFAGEFDRGTIKNLLTRPITRTDLFLAKCLTVLAVGLGIFLFVLYVSLAYGMARGEMGPIWLSDQYLIQRPYELIASEARTAVLMSLPAFLAAGFLGILVSNWTESSGYAVAIALVLFLFGDVATGLRQSGIERYSFLHYPSHVLGQLPKLAEGFNEPWDKALETGLLYVKVPLLWMAGFVAAAYALFIRRNVHA